MINWFNTAPNASVVVIVFVLYLLSAAVTTYDIHLMNLQKNEDGKLDLKMLPRWIGFLHWAESILFLLMVLLNWKFAIVIWILKSILQALFILEVIGYIIIYPFKIAKDYFP
jgi:hypothetical protein